MIAGLSTILLNFSSKYTTESVYNDFAVFNDQFLPKLPPLERRWFCWSRAPSPAIPKCLVIFKIAAEHCEKFFFSQSDTTENIWTVLNPFDGSDSATLAPESWTSLPGPWERGWPPNRLVPIPTRLVRIFKMAAVNRVLSIQSHVVSGYVGNNAATFPLQVRNIHRLLVFLRSTDAVSCRFELMTWYECTWNKIVDTANSRWFFCISFFNCLPLCYFRFLDSKLTQSTQCSFQIIRVFTSISCKNIL